MKRSKFTMITIVSVIAILFMAPVMAENTALSFTGANEDYVDCGNDLELQMGTHDLTVEFWLKTSASGVQRILSNGGQTDSDDGYSIWILTNGKLRAGLSDGTTGDGKQNDAVLTDGNWHHCMVVFDRDHKLWVCVDGTCQTKLIDTLSGLNFDNTSSTLVMGRTATSNSNNSFTGSLDEVRIWNTALVDTATVFAWQNQELTSSHPNISALQVYYKFNEGSGTTANDLTYDYLGNYESDGTIDGAQYVASDISDFTMHDDGLGVGDETFIPEVCALHQNYPNPFNPVTTLNYDLPEQSMVGLTVYDLMGREVTTLVNQVQKAGYHTIRWNGTYQSGQVVSAGVYIYRITAGDFISTKKAMLLK